MIDSLARTPNPWTRLELVVRSQPHNTATNQALSDLLPELGQIFARSAWMGNGGVGCGVGCGWCWVKLVKGSDGDHEAKLLHKGGQEALLSTLQQVSDMEGC